MPSDNNTNDSDSDSNSSLPDLSDLLPAPSTEISKGDIVWAKHKRLYWPALVRHVYHKQKKLTIWYTDDPGKNFKLPLKNIFLFSDSEMSAKIKNYAIQAGVIESLEGLTSHAASYLKRKAEGHVDDPRKFFDQTYPFFLVEQYLEQNPNSNINDFSHLKIPPLYLDHLPNVTAIRKSGNVSGEVLSDDSEIMSADDSESNESSTENDHKKLFVKQEHLDVCENEYVNKIVTLITTGKADKHLKDVMLKKIYSQHYEFYIKAIASDKRDLNYIASHGPVEDIEKLRELINYLLDLYKKVSSVKARKKTVKIDLLHSCSSKVTENAQFVASVWLPESIIYAISKIKNISLSKAKESFHKTSVCKREEIKNLIDCVNVRSDINEAANWSKLDNVQSDETFDESNNKKLSASHPDISREPLKKRRKSKK